MFVREAQGSARVLRTLAGLFVAVSIVSPCDAVDLRIALSPAVQNGTVVAIHVTEDLSEVPSTPSWSIARKIPHARDIPGSIRDLLLEDALGVVPLQAADADLNGTPVRRWTPTRPTQGNVRLSYTLDAQPVASAGGPPYGMIPAGGGIAGATSGLLVLPDNGPWNVTMRADLAQLVSGSVAMTSKGFLPMGGTWSGEGLSHVWVAMGPGRQVLLDGFRGLQLGPTPPAAGDLLGYASRSYTTLSRLFAHVGQRPYWFMIRAVDGRSFATGSAEENGTLVTTGSAFTDHQDADYLHDIVFHELTHQWTGHNDPEEAWFVEGLTTYVADILRCEERLDPWASCARQASLSASTAYGVAASWSIAKISAAPFTDESVRRTPYGRGMLYFARLDALARRLHHVSLLQAMRPLFASREAGSPITRQAWEGWLTKTFGPLAVSDFHKRILDGQAPQTAPETAFARCLEPVRFRTKPAGTDGFANAWFWRSTGRCDQSGAPARHPDGGISSG